MSSQVVAGTRAGMADIRSALADFRRIEPGDKLTARVIPSDLAAYETAVAREFELLKAGQIRRALAQESDAVDPDSGG